MYKQVIVVNKELAMSAGKMSAQVSHASMAFLSKIIQKNTKKVICNQFPSWHDYRREDLYVWAEEARKRGEAFFYAKPIDPNKPNGKMELCDPEYTYLTHMMIDNQLYEDWLGGIFTKVILEAKNENQMKKIVEKANDSGLFEGKDFFCIRDACLTELKPDETGTRWTCIGFAPMDSARIDPITKRLQLYKDNG